jgi:hypothetical protein
VDVSDLLRPTVRIWEPLNQSSGGRREDGVFHHFAITKPKTAAYLYHLTPLLQHAEADYVNQRLIEGGPRGWHFSHDYRSIADRRLSIGRTRWVCFS